MLDTDTELQRQHQKFGGTMHNAQQKWVRRLSILLGIIAAVSCVTSSAGASVPYQEPAVCETCWNEYFVWEWKHNFPENSGMMQCNNEGGDGCHGTYFESGQCDDEHDLCPLDDVDYDGALAAAQTGSDLRIARAYLQSGVAILDSDAGLYLMKGCDGTIVASVSIGSRERLLQLTDD